MVTDSKKLDIGPVYSVQEVARNLKVDDRTIRKLIEAEVIAPEHWFYVGRQIRIRKIAIDLITGDYN